MVAYWRQFGCIAWWELLERHCFGNFRELLTHVTLSPAMGVYLSMRGSAKADGTGRQPDENYARELLQLFTIGLTALNTDGTPSEPAQDTYDATTISELAPLLSPSRGTWKMRSISMTGMYSSRTLTSWPPWATVLMSPALTWKDSTTEASGRM